MLHSTHPISKALQWLASKADFWAGQGWSFLLQCWGRFLYAPWDYVSMPIFKKKSSRRFLGKVPNFGYYIKMNFCEISKVWNFFPEIFAKIFSWKLAYLGPRCIQKRPRLWSMKFYHYPAQKSVFEASHCSAF